MTNENINPWLQIWVRPKKTLRALIDRDPRRVVLWLALISGALIGLVQSIPQPQSAEIQTIKFPSLFVMLFVLVIGAILGVISLYFMGWLLKVTGSWIGGKGRFIEVKCAVGWSTYPFIVMNAIALAASYGYHYLSFLVVPLGLISIILLVWGFVIYAHLIGEAHRFSAWRGLATLLIAALLIFAVAMILALLTPLLMPLFNA